MIDFTEEEIKEDRDRIISEMPERYGQTLDEIRVRFDSDIAYSEVMHPAFMLTEIVEQYLSDSPAVALDEQAFTSAHKANTHLFNLYQRLGQLRAYAEERVKTTPALNLPGDSGTWAEIYFKLGQAPLIRDEVKAHVMSELFKWSSQPLQPVIQSFHYLLQFMAMSSHSSIEIMPSVSIGYPQGMFSVVYSSADATEKFTVEFHNYDMHSVQETVNKAGQFGVGNTMHSLDSIRLPSWLR